METTQSSSTHQPITLHPTLVRGCRATALLGEALIRYQVNNTLSDRIHMLALASMANALGALTQSRTPTSSTPLWPSRPSSTLVKGIAELRDLCSLVGRPLPDPALLGKDHQQLPLEV